MELDTATWNRLMELLGLSVGVLGVVSVVVADYFVMSHSKKTLRGLKETTDRLFALQSPGDDGTKQ
jgi:hypothetical protein